ncbi:hypothetical protein C8R48DRAFT_678273 [Suillus tomentosus]|nr:hypothetical protein C8R48DRAFT_678273 [Suillus tomentosus]
MPRRNVLLLSKKFDAPEKCAQCNHTNNKLIKNVKINVRVNIKLVSELKNIAVDPRYIYLTQSKPGHQNFVNICPTLYQHIIFVLFSIVITLLMTFKLSLIKLRELYL